MEELALAAASVALLVSVGVALWVAARLKRAEEHLAEGLSGEAPPPGQVMPTVPFTVAFEGPHRPASYEVARRGRKRAVLAFPIECYRELRAVTWPSSSSLMKHVMVTVMAIVTCLTVVMTARVIAGLFTSAVGN